MKHLPFRAVVLRIFQDEQLKTLQQLLAKHGLHDFAFGSNKAEPLQLLDWLKSSHCWPIYGIEPCLWIWKWVIYWYTPPPPKFNIAPEKWWLADYFPFGKVTFQGLC